MKKNRHLYVNGAELYIDDDEIIALNKQVNNIAELKDRQADFTIDFNVPDTRENRRILEQANILSSETRVPYIKNSCTYVENGIELISNGYIMLISSEYGKFKMAAYSGNADFFKLIDGLKISQLALDDLNHVYQYQDLDELKYLFFDPAQNGGLLKSNIDTKYLRPFVSTKRLFNQIVQDQGWSVDGDLSFIDSWTLAQNLTPILTKYNTNGQLKTPISGNNQFFPDYNNFILNVDPYALLVFSPLLNFHLLLYFEKARYGKYQVTISGRFLFKNAGSIHFYLGDIDIGSNLNAEIVQDFSITYEYDITDSYHPISVIYAELKDKLTNSYFIFYEFKVEVKQTTANTLVWGSDVIQVAPCLPEFEQSKFLKNVANQYGLIFEADSFNRKLKVWRFGELSTNISKSVDWSKYFDNSPESTVISYSIGDYCRNNTMKYKSVDDVPSGYADANLIIDNETLDATKELFTLDIAPSQDIIYSAKSVAKIPLYAKNDSDEYESKDNNDLRMVKYRQTTLPFSITGASGTMKLAYFLVSEVDSGLGFNFSLIRDHYQELSRVLNGCKVVNCKMAIPALELQSFNHYIPVYLSQFNTYFYVNKITSWQNGKKCNVELVKIL